MIILDLSMFEYLLALNAHPKIGSQTIKKMLAVFCDNPKKLWESDGSKIGEFCGDKVKRIFLEAKNTYIPENEVEKLKKFDIGYITIFDKEYPEIMKEMYDAPVILYLKGNTKAFKSSCLAVVGSRKFTSYGKRVAQKLSKDCAEAGLSIVSGLALGIDAEAHRAALDVGGITIGVLGCGLDKIYPSSNQGLANDIVNNGGLIISEYPPGTEAFKQNFPARNRIIAGLSRGILVIEAAEKSGALITALAGLEYNRDIFAIPGPIDSETSQGCNYLIQNGAKLITKAEDILSELNIEMLKSTEKIKELIPESEEEKKLIEILSRDEVHPDVIVQESGMNVIALNSLLTIMEMKGLIENVGGRYRRKL